MKRLLGAAAAVFLALVIGVPSVGVMATPAQAESGFLKFLRGGREPVAHGNYRSDKSPIRRQTVRFDKYPPNTIFVDTAERRLYYTIGNGKALKYGIGVGRDGFRWTGTHKVTRKAEWPGWTPPSVMRARVKRETGRTLPAYVPGGPENPMGARALYIGSTIYRIHGTNQPWTIGKAMSSGCIRMANDDVIDLYNRVNVGTRVIVRQ